ncbi:hypothetical protein EK904_009373 [Melospiza melodia maxima]|nr:hypothetical protein EK904_009373 [Melospiza melodia maxima]
MRVQYSIFRDRRSQLSLGKERLGTSPSSKATTNKPLKEDSNAMLLSPSKIQLSDGTGESENVTNLSLEGQLYSEAGTFLVMEIKLDRPLVPKRLREELAQRCVRMGCGADSSSLHTGESLVQQTPLGMLHKEGLRQSPQESGGGFGQTALDVASGVLGKHLFIPAGISLPFLSKQETPEQHSNCVWIQCHSSLNKACGTLAWWDGSCSED